MSKLACQGTLGGIGKGASPETMEGPWFRAGEGRQTTAALTTVAMDV